MNQPAAIPTPPASNPAAPTARTYQPPTLTEKRALAEVTLLSGGRPTPGGPGQIGHP